LDFDDGQTLTHFMQTTYCPTCATSFKVTPVQLGQANGWVRCGRCQGVFEALLNTMPPGTFNEAVSTLPPKEGSTNPSAFQRRGLWLFASMGLALVLIAQVAWMGRHRLFTQISALQPVLQSVCVPFQCEVTWPRSPDVVKIEHSSFSEVPTGGYVVNLRVRNTAHYAVATPALELSLLDLQDQVVLRRVFIRDELGLDDHLLPLREVHGQVHFDLVTADNQDITGFRALIFYP